MKFQILGTGCEKCRKLFVNVEKYASTNNIECEIEKVSEITQIAKMGVMVTPALAIDGKVVSTGKVLSVEDIAKLANAQTPACECGCGCSQTKAVKTEEITCACSADKDETISIGKRLLSILLLVFVLASLGFMIYNQIKPQTTISNNEPILADSLVVYYFHGTKRCMTCNAIETLAKEAITTKFADELANSTVVFRSINVELPENEHYIKDFQLATRSVVMQKNGKYQQFNDVWTLVHSPEEFITYLQDGATNMLNAEVAKQ